MIRVVFHVSSFDLSLAAIRKSRLWGGGVGCGLNSPSINPFALRRTEFENLIRVCGSRNVKDLHYFQQLFWMGHSAAVWDCRAATEITKDWNGIDQIVLRNPRGALARVSLHGAQVTSWRNEHGEELLFTSSKAIFKAPKAIRGGIPICFPQFGTCGSLELHGFARNRMWFIDDNPPPLPANDSIGKSFVDLLLKSSEEDMKCWPHSFEFRLRVSLTTDGDLNLISRVRNINGKPFSFSFAYHTYLLVSDISEIRIEGLETLDYLDNLLQKERFTEQGDAITFESEVNPLESLHLDRQKFSTSLIFPWQVDRVYLSSPNIIAVLDHERKRTFVMRKEGLPDVAVWNPWDKKAKSMVDMGDEEYKQMLCVDGAIFEKPVILKPGEEWTGRLQLSVVASSFCSERLGLDRDGL
ncbi:hypothetical protein Ahy_B01g052730 isoform B [Arachis hypogaea]|uniref:glucose-6-phosphate 1-epimerase n=1 Tax=Arachis hypogaea TaxID=3818 RepID=A0A445AQ70_ARAHY|nr:hypothetical protein Ahy_B01g052730 isoform B [Arachis hypogaea]